MTSVSTKVKMAENGRLVLPKAVRQAAGISGETSLVVSVQDGEITLSTPQHGLEKARELYRRFVKKDISSDEFLATRERD